MLKIHLSRFDVPSTLKLFIVIWVHIVQIVLKTVIYFFFQYYISFALHFWLGILIILLIGTVVNIISIIENHQTYLSIVETYLKVDD